MMLHVSNVSMHKLLELLEMNQGLKKSDGSGVTKAYINTFDPSIFL